MIEIEDLPGIKTSDSCCVISTFIGICWLCNYIWKISKALDEKAIFHLHLNIIFNYSGNLKSVNESYSF